MKFLTLLFLSFANLYAFYEIKEEKIFEKNLEISCFLPLSDIYLVGDSENHSIFVYDKNFNFLYSFGELKKSDDGFEIITEIESDGKFLYIVGHLKNISIFDIKGKFLSFIDTGKNFVRKIRFFDNKLIFATGSSPIIHIYEKGKEIKSFGEYPANYKSYPTGVFVSIDTSKEGIFLALPLSYPLRLYDFEGNLIKEIGKKEWTGEIYENFNPGTIKVFEKYIKIIDINLINDYIIITKLLPKESNFKYGYDLIKKDGKILVGNFKTNDFLAKVKDGKLYFIEGKNKLKIGILK